MGKKPIIKLRAYRGTEINYDANGKVKNENNLVSLEYGTRMWELYLKNLKLSGLCRIEVESGFKVLEVGYEPIKDLSVYEKEVQDAFISKEDVALTPDQQRIADLEAKLDLFMKKEQSEKNIKSDKKVYASIKDEYIDIVGKRPFGAWDDETIKTKLEEFNANK